MKIFLAILFAIVALSLALYFIGNDRFQAKIDQILDCDQVIYAQARADMQGRINK